MTTAKDKKILKKIQTVFDDTRKQLVRIYKKDEAINMDLTHGMIPVFRYWFGETLDREYMYELSEDAIEEVSWMFDEFESKLADKRIHIVSDEGDGSVIWAMDDATVEEYSKEMEYSGGLDDDDDYGVDMLKIKKTGEDDWGRMTYEEINTGERFVDVDDSLHTVSPEGEPEARVRRNYVQTDDESENFVEVRDALFKWAESKSLELQEHEPHEFIADYTKRHHINLSDDEEDLLVRITWQKYAPLEK